MSKTIVVIIVVIGSALATLSKGAEPGLALAPTGPTSGQPQTDALQPAGICKRMSGKVFDPRSTQAANFGVRAEIFGAQPSASDLAEIAKLIDAGKVKTVVETTLPLVEARRAHEIGQSGHARGKIVLLVA